MNFCSHLILKSDADISCPPPLCMHFHVCLLFSNPHLFFIVELIHFSSHPSLPLSIPVPGSCRSAALMHVDISPCLCQPCSSTKTECTDRGKGKEKKMLYLSAKRESSRAVEWQSSKNDGKSHNGNAINDYNGGCVLVRMFMWNTRRE